MALIKLFANLRNAAGVKETSAEGSTLGEVMQDLVAQYPALCSLLLENGQLRQHVILTINGHPTADLQAQVAAQDQIGVFPPLGGG